MTQFPWSICNGCGMQAGNAYHSGHLVPSPFLGGLHVLWLLRPDSPTLDRLNDLPKLTFTELRGFHGAFATGGACQQGALTLPDPWFRPPFWDLLMLQLLRPNSSNLPCLYSTFHFEYPLVLSRFCFTDITSLRKRLGNSLGHKLNFCPNLVLVSGTFISWLSYDNK